MKRFLLFLTLALLSPLTCRFVLAQTAVNPSVASNSPNATAAAQAPEEMTRKISELVHSGKYVEAQQLTTGLLIAYPNDERLIKAKALIEQLLAASAAPNTAPQPATPAPAAEGEELTGMDKVDYNALVQLAREAQQTTDPVEQDKLLKQFMTQSESFLQKHPKQLLLWQLRAACAIAFNQPLAGYEAGQKLLAAGGADSNDPNVQRILGQLRNKGWLNLQDAQSLQVVADKERAQKNEADERLRNTFPVVHAKVGFGSNGYGYGHMTFTAEGAVYEGTDETIRLNAADIREVKVACNTSSCGMYFTPKSGRRYFFLPVTEECVINRTDKGSIYFKPAVLGNAVVRRWGFVKADNKTLVPPPGGFVPKPAAATSAPALSSAPTVKPVAVPVDAQLIPSGDAQPSEVKPAATPDVKVAAAPVSIHPSTPKNGLVPDSGKAVLHLYRLSHFAGSGIKPHITVDGNEVAQLASGQAIQVLIDPGKHTIGGTEKRAKIENSIPDLNMEAGKEYWVRISLQSGWMFHVKLDLLAAEMASAESANLHQVEPSEKRKK
ncbi:MAG TPA: hypothetical protein VF786_10290 [Terriglobales bacterium]